MARAISATGQGQDQVGGAELDGGAGHPPDDAGGLVLGDGEPAGPPEGQEAGRAVAAHPGQEGRGPGSGQRSAALRKKTSTDGR